MALKAKAWLGAFRLRTLPLAFSSIIMGSGIAYQHKAANFNTTVLVLSLVTTLLLQVLSNLANDFGDSEKGTDNADRIGPQRAIQSGVISFSEMKIAIYITVALALVSGIWLIIAATGGQAINTGIFFFVLGIAAIAAAIKYTVGKNAYGYMGLGDIFVLLFFGWVGVCGSYYLQTHILNPVVLLPATTIGAFATSVLHLNNMRDRLSDAKAGKNTLAVKLGFEASKLYFYLLVVIAAICMLLFINLQQYSISKYIICFATFLPFIVSSVRVARITNPKDFDPLLKVNALSTFVFAIVNILSLQLL